MPSLDPEQGETAEVRCTCPAKRLLAAVGRNPDGVLFVHVKVIRNRQTVTQAVFRGGVVDIYCKSCGRWFRIRMAQAGAWSSESHKPSGIPG